MSTDLTTQVTTYVPIAGMENLTSGDYTLPRLKLVQPQDILDGADTHQGQWAKTDTGEFIAKPTLLYISIAKSRVLFPEKFNRESEPLCRSDDAITPSEDTQVAVPAHCTECEYAQWGKDEKGKSIPPRCTVSDNWAAILDTGEPVLVQFSRSSAKVSTFLKNMARAAMLRKGAVYVRMGSRKEISPSGFYYVPVVELIQEPPPDWLLQIGASFAGANLAARAMVIDVTPDVGRQAHWADGSDALTFFLDSMKQHGITGPQWLVALGVKDLVEYPGTVEEAVDQATKNAAL